MSVAATLSSVRRLRCDGRSQPYSTPHPTAYSTPHPTAFPNPLPIALPTLLPILPSESHPSPYCLNHFSLPPKYVAVHCRVQCNYGSYLTPSYRLHILEEFINLHRVSRKCGLFRTVRSDFCRIVLLVVAKFHTTNCSEFGAIICSEFGAVICSEFGAVNCNKFGAVN